MGFWKEMFSNLDEPCVWIRYEKNYSDDEPQQMKVIHPDAEEIEKLKLENKELKRLLMAKRVNAIEVDGKRLLK